MKRNTALFGASLVAGVAAASGLIMTSNASSAATGFGANWAATTQGTGSGGAWKNGAYGGADEGFSGNANGTSGTFSLAAFDGPTVNVSVSCDGANPVTTVTGGGAAGTYKAGASVTLAKFSGVTAPVEGTVTFGAKSAGHSAGALVNLNTLGDGSFVALAGIDCSAATTPPTTPPPTSTTTPPPTTTATNPPTSTGTNPPSSTTTNPPTSAPPTTPPPTTEPPTPTPTTTTLPVTG